MICTGSATLNASQPGVIYGLRNTPADHAQASLIVMIKTDGQPLHVWNDSETWDDNATWED